MRLRLPHKPEAKRCGCLACRLSRIERAFGQLPPVARPDDEPEVVPWSEMLTDAERAK